MKITRTHRFLLAVSSGVLLSLPWLGLPGWLLFIAFIPLLFIDHFFVENKANFQGVSFWGHAFVSAFSWNILTSWWIAHATFAGAAMAILINSFLMSLVWWLAHTARRKLKGNLGYLAWIVFYLSFEYLHFNWDIQWPWLTLGNGFANSVHLIQWYEYTGVLGGSLWVLVVNLTIFQLLKQFVLPAVNKNQTALIIQFCFVLFLPAVISYLHYFSYTEKTDPINVLIVQPNVNPYSEKYDFAAEQEKLQKLIRLAESEMDETVDFVLAPETVFERYAEWNEDLLSRNRFFNDLEKWLNNYPNTALIFGASTSKIYSDSIAAPSTARKKNGVTFDVFNSALQIDKTGKTQIYHKSILVSGVEKVPYLKHLGFLQNLFFDLGGTSGNLGIQKEVSVFTSANQTKVAPIICYESVFGGYITNYVKKGAEVLFIITNDGWWKNTPGYKQHFSFARLRAIETRRSIARAGNTGISGFINQRGERIQQSDWWTETAIKNQINKNSKLTFYAKNGDFIGRISALIGALLFLLLLANPIKNKQKETVQF